MKILHIGKYGIYERGGIESVCAQLSINKRVEQTFLTFKTKDYLHDAQEIQFDALRWISKPVSLQMLWWVVKHHKRYDIIHVHYPNLALYLLVLLIRREKMIIHFHSVVSINCFYDSLVLILDKIIGLKNIHCVFTSQDYYEYVSNKLNRFFLSHSVIPLGKDYDHSSRCSDGNTICALVIGRLVRYKNHINLLESYKDNKCTYSLKLVGDGKLGNQIEFFIESHGLSSVSLERSVSNHELKRLLESSRCVALASDSIQEAYGVVLIEALAHGIPIVTLYVAGSGMNYVNSDRKAGVIAGSMKDFNFAVQKFVNMPLDEWCVHSQAARRHYEANFTGKAMMEKWTTEYNSFLRNK